jgi:parvulin-like peptidyl-prolyl isomerase
MRTKLRLAGLVVLALLAGLLVSELLCRSAAFRDLAGRLTGRGHLVAIANGKGIYETDIGGDKKTTVSELIIGENLRRFAAQEIIDPARIDHELALVKAQFANDKAFVSALKASGFSMSSLRDRVAADLRGLRWLEKQIAPATVATEQQCRQFYEAHQELFLQPLRYRAAHLFLAAHAGTPPEVIEEKEKAIAVLAGRLAQGEAFFKLATEASEDEASKSRGGDLGFFSESRMAPEFFTEVQKLRVGKTSKPFRTHLGFHIAQLTDIKAARLLSFEEARPEVLLLFANERRALQADRLAQTLSRADVFRSNMTSDPR